MTTLLQSTDVSNPFSALAIDETYAYVAHDTEILRVPKSGGPSDSLSASVSATGRDFFGVDESSIWWMNGGPCTDGNGCWGVMDHAGTLYRMPKTGGAAVAVANNVIGQVAWDATYVYYASDAIYRVPKTGGAPEVLTQDIQPWAITAMAVDSQYLYMASGNDLYRVAVAGGHAVLFASMPTSTPASARKLKLDYDTIYLRTETDYAVQSDDTAVVYAISKSTGDATTLASPPLYGNGSTLRKSQLDINNKQVFFDGSSSSTGPQAKTWVWRENADGTQETSIIQVNDLSGLAVDDDAVFTLETDRLSRVAR